MSDAQKIVIIGRILMQINAQLLEYECTPPTLGTLIKFQQILEHVGTELIMLAPPEWPTSHIWCTNFDALLTKK